MKREILSMTAVELAHQADQAWLTQRERAERRGHLDSAACWGALAVVVVAMSALLATRPSPPATVNTVRSASTLHPKAAGGPSTTTSSVQTIPPSVPHEPALTVAGPPAELAHHQQNTGGPSISVPGRQPVQARPPATTVHTAVPIDQRREGTGNSWSGEDLSPGRYVEAPDAGNFIVHPASPGSPAGMALTEIGGPERLRLSVDVTDRGETGSVVVHLVNVSGRTMRFAEGVHVHSEVSLDGRPWQAFELRNQDVTELAPGQDLLLETSFAFGDPGEYSAGGSITIELV